MEVTDQVRQVVGVAATIGLGSLIGAVLGVMAALVALAVLRKEVKASSTWKLFVHRVSASLVVCLLLFGLWLGYTLVKPGEPPSWYADVQHGLLLLVFATSAWFWYRAFGWIGEPGILVDEEKGRDARRLETQVQVLRRVAQVTVVVLAVVFALLTFPQTRAPMLSLLASAGVLSVVAGLAAQTSLGNMFAGIQLAFTDAIMVGDTVVIPEEGQPGSIEEITLTYVVVRIWDERRIIVPSTDFTTRSFENWTRRAVKQLAVTTLQLDWNAPIAEIRAEVGRLVEKSPLWDGRSWSAQVFTLSAPYLEVRISVSADNWAAAWDLRSYVRENILAWIIDNAPEAIPRQHMQMLDEANATVSLGTEQVDPKLLEDPQYVGPAGGGGAKGWELTKADPDEVMRKEAEQRRRRTSDHKPPRLLGRFLFSGTKDAEERAQIYRGPGEDALKRRKIRDEYNASH